MSDTVDTDIEANAILNSYMYRVLQKTLPRRSWEEWGLSTQDALDAGFNAAPTRTWLWNRTNSGSCAVNADAVVMVAGLTRLALEGKIAKKFNPQNTAEKVLIFFSRRTWLRYTRHRPSHIRTEQQTRYCSMPFRLRGVSLLVSSR